MIQSDSFARYCATLMVLLCTGQAAAQTTAEKAAFCGMAGEVAAATTAARDAGVSKDEAQGLADGAAMDGNAKVYFSALISLIYTMDGVEGPTMRQVAVQMCQKKMGLK